MRNKKAKFSAIALSLIMCITLIGCNCSGSNKPPKPDPDPVYATLSFETNGGTEIAPITKEVGEALTATEIATAKDYYSFDGWYDAEYKIKYPLTTMPDADMTVYASWIASQAFTVDFVSNGGTEISRAVAAVGETVARPADPTKEHYVFSGWYLNADFSGNSFNFSSTPSNNITLYAKWVLAANMALVTYVGNGEVFAQVPVEKGEVLAPDADIFGADMEYTTWFTDEDYQNVYSPVAVSEDITLYTLYGSKDLNYNGSEVVSYSGNSETVVIQNKNIYYVAASAFRNNTTIKKVILGSSITQIRAGAFAGCTNLEEIVMPGVKAIRTGAFLGAIRLTKVKFPATLETIGTYAFCDTRLSEADLSECTEQKTSELTTAGIKTIEVGAFKNITNLKSVLFPSSLTRINADAFFGCDGLTNVDIPAGVTSIGEKAFARCSALQSVTVDSANANYAIKDGNLYSKDFTNLILYVKGAKVETEFFVAKNDVLNKISADAFYGADNLTVMTIDKSLTLSMGAFTGLNNLTTLTLSDLSGAPNIPYMFGAPSPQVNAYGTYTPSTLKFINFMELTAIPEYCFYGLKGLEAVTSFVDGGFTSIGDYAYAYSGITSFIVDKNLTRLGVNVFVECLLSEITVDPANPYFSSVNGGLYSVVSGVKTLHKAFATLETMVVAEDTNIIDHYAFYACNSLKNLTVPFIGETAATNANSFISYIFGSPSAELSGLYMPALETLTVSKAISGIPYRAFYRTSIKRFDLRASENTLRTYGDESFSYNEVMEGFVAGSAGELTPFYNPGGKITGVGAYAFAYCYLGGGTKTLTLTSGIASVGIGAFAFNEFAGLDAANATGLSKIPDYMMFMNPYMIGVRAGVVDSMGNPVTARATFATLPNTVATIGGYAFSNYDFSPEHAAASLNGDLTVSFPNGSSLTSFGVAEGAIISKSFTMGGVNTFEVPNTTVSLGGGVFSYCPLLELSFEENSVLTSLGLDVFENTLLPEVIHLPATVRSISSGAFGASKGTIYFPDIRHNNLRELHIGNAQEGSAITSMWNNPFNNCINLRKVYIYKNVTESVYCAQSVSGSGVVVTNPNGVPRFYWSNNPSTFILGSNLSSELTVYVTQSSLTHFQAFPEWAQYNLTAIV